MKRLAIIAKKKSLMKGWIEIAHFAKIKVTSMRLWMCVEWLTLIQVPYFSLLIETGHDSKMGSVRNCQGYVLPRKYKPPVAIHHLDQSEATST